jgi:histidyl-tRNA synthetase
MASKTRVMQTHRIERVNGVIDALPQDCQLNQDITARLHNTFASFAYQPIDVPILEQPDLYLRKSGEEIIDRLYDFVYRNRRLCLRPEMTASVMRAFLDHFSHAVLPVRLCYAGPVFRYEQPEDSHYRQFTQIGVEFIGASGAMADAEVIHLACRGLDNVGIQTYQVVIGHIGVLNRFLDNLDLDDRLRSLILSSLPLLHQPHGKEKVVSHLAELYPELRKTSESAANGDPEAPVLDDALIGLFRGMDNQAAKTALLDLLARLNIGLAGNREPDEIVERLLTKLKRQDQSSKISVALDFMQELSQIKGEPQHVLAIGRDILNRYGLEPSPLDDLGEIAEILQWYGLPSSRICLDLGLSRGLQYYTGMVFELHPDSQPTTQLCGGGRYDDLIGILGGAEIPATGFAFNLERLRHTLEQEGRLGDPHVAHRTVQVIPHTASDRSYAVQVAEQFRQAGIATALDLPSTGSAPLADHSPHAFWVTVGAVEQARGEVLLHNPRSQTQETVAIAAAIHIIQQSH